MGRARFIVPLALLLTAACDSPAGPMEGGEAYELKSVAGDEVPAIVLQNEHVTVVLLADTLRFFGEGRGVELRHQEVTYTNGPETPEVSRIETAFGYGIAGDSIEISYVCPSFASCIAGPHLTGRVDGGVLRLNAGFGVHVYERVPEG
jgi:hypothetical protein